MVLVREDTPMAVGSSDFGMSRAPLLPLVTTSGIAALLVIDPLALHAFDLPKAVAMHAFAGALAILLIRTMRDAPIPTWRSFWPVALLVLAAGVSTVTAADVVVALIGETGRYLGLAFVVDMAILTMATALAVRSADDWSLFLVGVLTAIGLVIAYAWIQSFGLDPIPWTGHDRPFSTLGNPDVLGQVLGIGVGLALGVTIVPHVSAVARLAAGSLAATSALTVFMIGGRAAIIGLIAVAAAAPFTWAYVRRSAVREAVRRIGATLVLAALAASPLIIDSTVAVRVRDTMEGESAEARPLIWASAVGAFLERPLLGWGPDSVSVAYHRHRLAATNLVLGPGRPVDSAHNALLQAATTMGIPGLLALVAFVTVGSLRLLRLARLEPLPGLALLLAWTSYWTQALLTVGAVATDWLPWVAFGATMRPALALAGPAHRLVIAVFAVVALVATAAGALALAADHDARSIVRATSERAESVVDEAHRAVSLEPWRAEHWNRLGIVLEATGRWDASIEAYAAATVRRPDEPSYRINLARANVSAGRIDEGLAAARTAVVVSKNDPLALRALAVTAIAAARCDEALRAALDAWTLLPDVVAGETLVVDSTRCAAPAVAIPLLEQAIATRNSLVLRRILDVLRAGTR